MAAGGSNSSPAPQNINPIGKPIAGPKDYVYRGSSGMPETIKRKDADSALAKFLGEIPVIVAVGTLKANPHVLRNGIQYQSIRECLSSLCQCEEDDVPLAAVVAIWAKALYG